jgi:hypothetical protein
MPENRKQIEVNHAGYPCIVQFSRYPAGGAIAICLVHRDDYDPVAVATVNMPEVSIGENQVIIKTWSENEGILETLEQAGVLRSTDRGIQAGFAVAEVCDLLVDPGV